jgi:hypothetical protein
LPSAITLTVCDKTTCMSGTKPKSTHSRPFKPQMP